MSMLRFAFALFFPQSLSLPVRSTPALAAPGECERNARESACKDVFLAVVAHELRNTMAPLESALEILGASAGGSAVAQHSLDMGRRQLKHMGRLVEDLLDVGRMVTDQLEVRLARVCLQESVAAAVQAAMGSAARRSQRITVDMPEERLVVDADPLRLEQMLANLLGNAIKFTGVGGRIDVSLQPAAGGQVNIVVQDNGEGIAPQSLESVFQIFRRAERDRTSSDGGLGIGLALVRRLAQLQGGTVRAFSDGKGRGSRFVITLPR